MSSILCLYSTALQNARKRRASLHGEGCHPSLCTAIIKLYLLVEHTNITHGWGTLPIYTLPAMRGLKSALCVGRNCDRTLAVNLLISR